MGHSPPRAPHHETPSETCEAPNSEARGVPSRIRQIPNPRSCGYQIQKLWVPNPETCGVPNHTIRDPTQSLTFISLPDAGPREPTVTQNSVVRDSGDVVEDRIIRHQGMPPMPDDQSKELRRPHGYAARGWCWSCREHASANRRRRPHARPPGRGRARAGRC